MLFIKLQKTLYYSYSDNKNLVNGGHYTNLKIENNVPLLNDEKLINEIINETLKIL